MTDRRRTSLSLELLGLFVVCLILALLLNVFLIIGGTILVDEYCWQNDIILDEDQMYHANTMVFSIGLLVSIAFFVLLFLILIGERLAYIRKIIKGVDALQRGEHGYQLPLEGNNELTHLAEAINYLSQTEQQIKIKEATLQREKEELIRTLSHDIRTPLTSIMSYTELLNAKQDATEQEHREYLSLVSKKTAQIKELTDILLDGGRRSVEFFSDAQLLVRQFAAEFEEVLEDDFSLEVDLSRCPTFSAAVDPQELRRIFDNLISNIQKYADPQQKVTLTVQYHEQNLIIKQSNHVMPVAPVTESHHMGLNSIRRIAQNYGGNVKINQSSAFFEITVTLSKI